MQDQSLEDKYNFLFHSPSLLMMLQSSLKQGLRLGLSTEFTKHLYLRPMYGKGTLWADRILIFLVKIMPMFII